MFALVPYIVIAWIGVTLILFRLLPRPVAVITACLAGTLFLPEVQWSPIPPNNAEPIRFPPFDFTKINSISYGLLFAWLIFDHGQWRHVRWNRWDLPAFVLGLFPAVASLLAGQSAQDAFKDIRFALLQWTVPYCIGRIYLSDVAGCRRVAIALALGGLIYVPFCLLELRISPQLHNLVFGFQQHSFLQVMRSWGYRPMVFMQHGLALGLFMWLAALSLTWLWWSGAWPPRDGLGLFSQAPVLFVLGMLAVAVLCKSTGALILGAGGIAVLFISTWLRLRMLLLALACVLPAYAISRAGGWISSDAIISAVGNKLEAERSESFEFRLVNEDKFMARIGSNIWTGIGSDRAKRPQDHNGKPLIIDGQWMMAYFDNGIVGVMALSCFFLLPALRYVWLHPPQTWADPTIAPAAIAAMVCVLLSIDCIPNAMLNPFYMLIVAALTCWNDGMAAMQQVAYAHAANA